MHTRTHTHILRPLVRDVAATCRQCRGSDYLRRDRNCEDVTETSLRLVGDIMETSPRLVGDIMETSPRLVGDIMETSPRLVGDIMETSPRLLGRKPISKRCLEIGFRSSIAGTRQSIHF